MNAGYDYALRFETREGYVVSEYIEPGGKKLLTLLTRKYLEDQGLYSDQINQILKSWDTQTADISVEITYTDILGEKQKDLCTICGGSIILPYEAESWPRMSRSEYQVKR